MYSEIDQVTDDRAVQLMTIHNANNHSYTTSTVFRGANGSLYCEADNNAKGYIFAPSFSAHEHFLGKGYIEDSANAQTHQIIAKAGIYKTDLHPMVDYITLSTYVKRIYADDPLYKKYVVNGKIACRKTSMSSRSKYSSANCMNSDNMIDYKDCQEIVILLQRILDGVTYGYFSQQQKSNRAIGLSIFVGLALMLLGIFLLGLYIGAW